MFQLQLFFAPLWRMGPRCSSAETQVCHRSYIIAAMFRCSATFLNYDLFKVNIIYNPSCSCGAIREDSYHYFFECPLYNGIRNDLLNCLDYLPNDCHLDLNLLIFDNSTLTNEQNELVLKKVFDYIKKVRTVPDCSMYI